MKNILALTIALLFVISAEAQEFSQFTKEDFKKDKNYGWFNYIQVTGYRGQHLISSELQDFFSDGFNGIGIRLGTQSTGRKDWQRVHNYPQYGLGVSFFSLGSTQVDSILGKPSSLYFFFGAPVARFGNFSFNIDTEIGISYDFNPYDSETNPYQNLIGASANLHANMSLVFYYQISKRMDIGLGAQFMHFSNGRSFTPQRGVNLAGINLTTAYHFNPVKNYTKSIDPDYQPAVRPTFIEEEKSPFSGRHELSFMGSIGTVQAEPGEWKHEDGQLDTTNAEGPRYMTNSFSVDYGYQFARRFKAVAGLDMFYDGSAEYLHDDILPQNTTFADKSFYGAHVGFHYLIERISIVFNYGRYIYKPFENRGNWYMRAGGRIGISEKMDIQIALKTRNGGIADWIEWGIVYKIKSKQ